LFAKPADLLAGSFIAYSDVPLQFVSVVSLGITD